MRKLLILIPVATAAVVAADWALREYRPVRVPPALGREVYRMMSEGWTMPRWEPLGCRERLPHTHLTAPGGLRLTIGIDGVARVDSVPAF